jgi:aspartate/methionine/tyrosine aminotransferase
MDSVPLMLAEYRRCRARILAGPSAIPGVSWPKPLAVFCAFRNVSAQLVNSAGGSTALAPQVLEREHLAVVPGDAL